MALRNAVVNVALGVESDEVWTLVLLDLVDQLTAAHLVTLSLLNDVKAGRKARGLREDPGGTSREMHVREILETEDKDLVGRILRDLDQRQLTNNVGNLMDAGAGTTDTGKRLLRLITLQEDDQGSGTDIG